ncbi:hypothetical protein B0T21DRAFT_380443 [Apiosordaria backusii]|uniref:Uncharacterized protein n=1 Tax=Apiosordaria backusii TaxID=314023 RepID=A0AA40K7B7_9PEZI|nr:hypothetical protein B0T21DRAFT_380443 [Apiosordaria backusii]
MAASTPNTNRFSFRNPFHFFLNSNNDNNKENNNNNNRTSSRPSSPTSPGFFWSSLYRKSTTSSNIFTSSPATSVDSYFPSVTTPNDNLAPKPTCTCGSLSSSLSSSTASLSPPAAPKRTVTAPTPVIHVQPPVPGRKQIRVDPLSTQFPAPVTEASLEEMLARKPGRWSLTHYVRNAKHVERGRW